MPSIVVGVAGGSGSGKTTVVRELTGRLGEDRVTVVHHDAYYADNRGVAPEARAVINYDHPDALETPLLVRHLKALRSGEPVDVPVYDFEQHVRRDETQRAEPRPVIIVDGILILWHPELRELMDLKVFVDTDADIRFIRRLQRDIQERGRPLDSVIQQYTSTVRPMHLEFVEPTRRYADMILSEGGLNRVAVDSLAARINEVLAAR